MAAPHRSARVRGGPRIDLGMPLLGMLAAALWVATGCSGTSERAFEGQEAGDCVDGEDNDGDGTTDCADSDCELHIDCVDEDTDTWVPTSGDTGDTAPTGDIDGWDCDDDAVGWMAATGTVVLDEPSTGFAALCSGEFLTAVGYQVQWLDVDKEIDSTYYLVDQPGQMVLDGEFGSLWVQQRLTGFLAIIDLDTAETGQVKNLDGPVLDMAIVPGNKALVSIEGANGTGHTSIAVVGGQGAYIINSFDFGEYGHKLAFNTATSKVFSGGTDIASYLYSGDVVTESQVVPNACASTPGNLSVSPDGAAVVYACSEGNNGSFALYDYDTEDLNVARGQYEVGATIDRVVHHADGSSLLVATEGLLKTFDTETYELIGETTPDLNSCSDAKISDLGWSRGGKVAYALYTCGADATEGVLAWWVVD